MFERARTHYKKTLAEIDEAGLTKRERIIESPQGASIRIPQGEVLNRACSRRRNRRSTATATA
jgi:hypothetical protein